MSNNTATEKTIVFLLATALFNIAMTVFIVWVFIVNLPILFSGDFSLWNVVFVALATIASISKLRKFFKK